ncbi:MAG: VWA domain-containing protein [Pseudomonadota bacterium]
MSLPPLKTICCSLIIGSLPAGQSFAQSCARDAMLVFDGSASMAEVTFDTSVPTRIEDARAAVAQAMPEIAPVRRVGLLTYGPGGGDSCTGINLQFAPIPEAAEPVIDAVDALQPLGLTPLTASVKAAAEALDYTKRPGIIVLVTDGNETCGGRPCALGTELAATARDLTVHVVGFRVVFDPFSWNSPEATAFEDGSSVARCLSEQTGGLYVDTQSVDELADALRQTLGCAFIG